MRTINLTALLSVVLCLLGTAAAHHHAGCLTVNKIPPLTEFTCEICYRRKPNAPNSVGCGPLVSEQDKCRFYQYFKASKSSRCAECETGFALDYKTNTCVKGTIQGCISEYFIPGKGHFCNGCNNGYANVQSTGFASKCIPASQVEKPIANCLWGGDYRKSSNFINCFLCKPGFSGSQYLLVKIKSKIFFKFFFNFSNFFS